MSTYTVTAGKGKAVHVASEGKTLCGTENRSGGTLVLLNSVEDATCKNCMKLNTTPEKETETVDEHLNTMSNADRFAESMEAQGYAVSTVFNGDTGMAAVTVRRTYEDGTRTTLRVVYRREVFEYARLVAVSSEGHTAIDMDENYVSELTYAQNVAAGAAA